MPLTNTLTTDHAPMPDPVVADAEPEFADVEPAVPADPLAIAESAGHAVARHVAVARLPVGARGQELLAALSRLFREKKLAALIVEQHAQKILPMTDRALILERGRVVHQGASAALLADPAPLERFLGVTTR